MHNKGAVWAIHRDSSNSSWVKGKVTTLLIAFYSPPPPVNSGLVSTTKYEFWLAVALKSPQQLFPAGLPLAGCFAGGGCSAANGAEQHPCNSAAHMHHVAAHGKPVVEVTFWDITIMPTHWPVPGLRYSSWSQRHPSHQCHGLPLWASFMSLLSFWVTSVCFSCWPGLCSQRSGNVSKWNSFPWSSSARQCPRWQLLHRGSCLRSCGREGLLLCSPVPRVRITWGPV